MIKSAKENNFNSYDYKAKTQLPLPSDEYKFRKSTSASLLSSRSLKSTNDLDDVKSPYNSITHKVRKILPHEVACKLGCKGKKCKYCNSANWTDDEMAIPGIFSHWITDDILAMARPRDELIKESDLIHKMKKAGIRSIFNLQTRYEHKDCGEGVLKDTGFSYDPNDFTSKGIYYYNFELEDYSIGSIHRMLDMVKVFDFSISEGRVAVHCHAGLGRTGLLISCYLIYLYRMNAKEAINFVRERRPNSVQMNDQIQAVKDFENYLKPLRVIYYQPNDYIIDSLNLESGASNSKSNLASFSLNTFLHRQRYILHGYERKQLKYIPKILFVCGEQLRKLANRWKMDGKLPRNLKDIKRISSEFDRDFSASIKSSSNNNRNRIELDPLQFIAEALATVQFSRKVMRKVEYYQNLVNDSNQGYDELSNDEDPFVLSAMIWSWLDQLKEPVLRDQEINILLKGYSHKSSNFDYVNWKDLDKGTLQTVNYLIGILNELIPLEEELKNDLISHLIACLTQTNIRYDNKEFNEENNDEFDSIQVLKPTKKLKKYNFLILKSLIKELVDKPNKFYDKNLKKSLSFKKEINQYDYEEEVFENSYYKNNEKYNNDDSDYRFKNRSRYNDY